MSKQTTPEAISQSDLLTQRIRNMVLVPVVISLLMIIVVVSLFLAGMVIIPVVAGIISVILQIVAVVEMRKLIAENRTIMKELSYIAEKNEEVINNFSHNIREPLNNLALLGGMLRDTSTSEKQQELVETFIISTNNMVGVVNELTMATAGNIAFETKGEIKFRLGPIINDTIELLKLNNRHEQSQLVYDDRGEGNTEFIGDPIIIKQILLDLLSTAITTTSGKVSVKIQAHEIKETERKSIEFTLSTNHPVIFINEEREHFSLAGRLIKDSRGYWQESSTGSGSVFSFTIVGRKSEKIDKPEPASSLIRDLRKESTKKELKDLSILLVEDNPINQRITQLMLGPLVRKIEVARNGKEALDMFGTSRYDLILMDVQMPIMNGLVSAEKIRALEISTQTHTPIIAITANAMLGDKEQCLAVGMDDYISKPIEPGVLIEKISALL